MAAPPKKISAASARAHTRKNKNPSSQLPPGVIRKLSLLVLVVLVAWTYQVIKPPPSKICGSVNGPPVTSSRIKLKDGRHLSYAESGVPKDKAKYQIIFIHGINSCKYDVFPVSQDLIEGLGIYMLSFDRAGYGESDPNPKQSEISTALDVEELATRLELGKKFYVIGHSSGGEFTWAALKYLPDRLAGAAIVAPISNYWWPGFPASISKDAFQGQLVQDQWAYRVSHYAPWLAYWWNNQKLFPASSVITNLVDGLSDQDKELFAMLSTKVHKAQVRQQGEFESVHRDLTIGFGSWKFNPMELEDPFPSNDGSVHLWHGAKDTIAPVALSRYISQKHPWVQYHELQNAGHMFPFADGMADVIIKALLLGDS